MKPIIGRKYKKGRDTYLCIATFSHDGKEYMNMCLATGWGFSSPYVFLSSTIKDYTLVREKTKGWINIYKGYGGISISDIHASRDKAIAASFPNGRQIRTVEIEYEEWD